MFSADLKQPKIKQQLPQNHLFQSIGLLKSNWLNSRGQLKAVNYGTAFLISDYILMTCSHNIYYERLLRVADQIQFLPYIQQGVVREKYYRSNKKLIIKREQCNETFKVRPIKQELCLVLLQSPFQTQLPKLKINSYNLLQTQAYQKESVQKSKLRIVGYPNTYFSKLPSLNGAYVRRKQLEGRLFAIDGCIIHHSCQTQPGLSGSPIFLQETHGTPCIIGIHTHRGYNGINSGLFFTGQILLKIKKFVKEINSEFNLSEKVNFIEPYCSKVDQLAAKPILQNGQVQDQQQQDYENQSDFEFDWEQNQLSSVELKSIAVLKAEKFQINTTETHNGLRGCEMVDTHYKN